MRKKLTRKQYAEKFEKLNYIFQDGEVIKQCVAPYPCYWFVSNCGYVLSLHGKKVKKLKARWNPRVKQWEYEYRPKGAKNNKKVIVWKIIAEYFCECQFETEEEIQTHHINPRKNFKPDESEKCNRADNLQALPKSIHKRATYFGNHTQDQLDRESDDRVKKAGCPDIQINLNSEQFMAWLISAMQDSIDRGVSPYAYLITNTDDSENKRVEVRKIGKVGYEYKEE